MTSAAAIIRVDSLRISFERIGPVPARRPKNPPVYGPLTIAIPKHTSKSVDAMIAYVTLPVREFVRMYLPDGVDRFTVSIDISPSGEGSVVVNGGLDGNARIARVDA